jgi:hypothetical protein
LLALPHAIESGAVTPCENLFDVMSPGAKTNENFLNENLLNAMTPSEKQWGEKSPRVSQLNVMTPSES